MVKIISDSTGDLTPELIKEYDISILPLHVHTGDFEYEDGPCLDVDAIYTWCDKNKATPKTSAFSIDTATSMFKRYLDKGMDIVCFTISQGMSSSYQIMVAAAEELGCTDRIKVIDSASLSGGLALLAVEASIMAKAGFSADDIAARMEKLKPKLRISFVVDTLTYLYRGGRCSGVAALAGSALRLHPCIKLSDGKMVVGKKYRGNISSVYFDYAKDLEEDMKNADPARVILMHSGISKDDEDALMAYLKGLNRFETIIKGRAGGVISSHCGPGTMGILFRMK